MLRRLCCCLLMALPLAVVAFSIGCSKESNSSAPAPQVATSPQSAAESPDGGPPAPAGATHGPVTASGVLDSMVAAYRNARTYADAGTIEVKGQVNDQKIDEKAPCSVTFERPSRLRLHVYQANLQSDGRQMRGWIDTQKSSEPFAGQVLALDAPATLTLEQIYSDEVLTGYLTQGIAGSSLQLLLLLGDDPLKEIQADAERPVLLEPEALDKQMCHRVLLARADGKLVLWVDQRTFALRRVEVPTDGFRKHLAQSGEVKSLSVLIDFAGARLNGKADEAAFRFDTPPDAKLVKKFDHRELIPAPTAPPAPSPLLGKTMPDFSLTDLAGQSVSRASLSGKVTVLDFWFTKCLPCRQTLPLLEQVYQKYRQHEQVRFVAVSVDPQDIGDEKLRSVFDELKVTVPIARDVEGKLSEKLGIPGYPTTVILGGDGKVQDSESGANPQLVALLTAKLERLLAGQDVYPQVLADYERRLAEHERSLKEPEIQKAMIAERSQPKRLKISKLWSCQELEQPGNITVVADRGRPPRLLVNDGWKRVVELTAEGTVAKKHELKLGDDDVIATLRTAVDFDGKRYFVGLASSQKQAHVFDDEFGLVSSYPADRDHAGIADAQLTDLDGDGRLELAVSYWGVVGVQGATLGGKRQWLNRSMEHVFRLAVSGPDAQGHRLLLCAHGQGTLMPLDHRGDAAKPIAVGTHFVRSVYAADLTGDGQSEYLGLASTSLGGDSALALSLTGQELWNYPLPKGVQDHPALEMVTFGNLTGSENQWVVAGADGSIHILTAEGELIDQFNYGAALSGLAVAHLDGLRVLLVATTQGVDAWEIK